MAYTVTGKETFYASGSDNTGAPSPALIPLSTSQITAFAPQGGQYGTNTATAGTTLTAANVGGAGPGIADAVYLNMTGTLAGAANAQMPTVAALVAQLPNVAAGQSYVFRVANTSGGAFAWTVTTNTGWTLNGTVTIAQNAYRDFLITFTSLTAATLQNIGGGTF